MGLFGKKKKEDEESEPKLGTPTDVVLQMRNQGMTDNQIVQSLQKDGYTSTQIFDALSQADIKKNIQPSGEGYPEEYQQSSQMQQPQMQQSQMQQPVQQPPSAQYQMPQTQYSQQSLREEIEEVAEAIIDEKWDELMKAVNKIISWKEDTEKKIAGMHEDIEDLKERFSELHKGVLGKVAEYDKGLREVGTDIKAMQKVFKKTLPKFTENIARLEKLSKPKKKSK